MNREMCVLRESEVFCFRQRCVFGKIQSPRVTGTEDIGLYFGSITRMRWKRGIQRMTCVLSLIAGLVMVGVFYRGSARNIAFKTESLANLRSLYSIRSSEVDKTEKALLCSAMDREQGTLSMIWSAMGPSKWDLFVLFKIYKLDNLSISTTDLSELRANMFEWPTDSVSIAQRINQHIEKFKEWPEDLLLSADEVADGFSDLERLLEISKKSLWTKACSGFVIGFGATWLVYLIGRLFIYPVGSWIARGFSQESVPVI